MDWFTAVSRRSHPFVNQLGKIVVILTFMFAAVGKSSAATTALNSVSCGSNAYSGPGTDACSVYLTATTRNKTYVALSSNNPAVVVPSQVTVWRGATSAGFNATVASVTTTQTATITAQAGGLTASFSITLSPSTTTGTAAVSVNATSISFGSVTLNSPVSQPLTVSSTGTAPLIVNSAIVSGAGFSVSGATLPATLNPGQSLALEAQFDPTTSSSYSGQLTIATSASNKTVALSGTGVSYAVNLSWSAPTSSTDPIAGYNVYRALSGTTSFQRLNGTIDTLTTFTDSSVQAGATYNYYVASVDAQGVESVPSNTFSATVL
jgi:hypothetical protein